MDLNLFRVFDAIYREGGLTRAGEQLHLTQPAVSHALARLRAECGDALFVKAGRRMLPTPRARAMAPAVQQALAGMAAAVAPPGDFDPARANRHFTLGLREVLEPFALQALLPHLMPSRVAPPAAGPGLTLALVRLDRERLEDDLRLGVLDAALDVALPVSRHIGATRLLSDPMVVLARQGHPLLAAGEGTATPAADSAWLQAYLQAEHVLVSTRRAGLGLEDAALGAQGLQRQIRLRCQSYHAACAAVAATDLLLTLPRRHAELSNAPWGHRLLPAPCTMAALEIHLYWDHRLDADPANQWLRQRLPELATVALRGQSLP